MLRRSIALFSQSLFFALALLGLFVSTVRAQSTGTIRGSVADATGAVLPNAEVTARQTGTNLERKTVTDDAGLYSFPALPAGTYRVEVKVAGFTTEVRQGITVNVSEIVALNFSLKVGEVSQTVTVEGGAPMIQTDTMTVGGVINQNTVQQIPLNGRHIEDLIQLVPGSVVPPQNGFLTAPLRGQGSFGAITAGNREDTVNFQVNGINLQDPVQNQTTFQPSINTVSEFKLLNSTFSAEYGHTSGSVMNVATRSGTNALHGEVFDFLRNDALDAKNFFTLPTQAIPPFKRNNFGVAAGGPIWFPFYDGRDKTFWFFSYEGLRQRQQQVFPTATVPTQAQRDAVTDPTVQALLPLIPLPNATDSNGVLNRFVGTGTAPVNIDQYTGDFSHQFTANDRFHGYYARQTDERMEPSSPVSASTLPGFGDTRAATRQILTLAETHIFSPSLVNEFRFGGNRIEITFVGNDKQDPAGFGFNGLTSFGLPEINVQGATLDFGGVAGFPQGREDTTWVWQDTVSWVKGKHNFRFGTEERKVFQNNFNNDMGFFQFPQLECVTKTNPNGTTTTTGFLCSPNALPSVFRIVSGSVDNAVSIAAVQFFAEDSYKLLPNLTLEFGYRFEWNTTPTERFDKFVAFDPATSTLRRVGSSGFGQIYKDNYNHMPRIGFAWDPFGRGKTSVRAGYGIFYDQPVTNSVTGLSSNPPFRNPVQINNPPSFADPFGGTQAAVNTLSPATISTEFANSYVQNWNLNIQQELTPTLGVTVGYFGSKGTHLRLSRNMNQPIGGVLPFPTLVSSSDVPCTLFRRPGDACPSLLVITQVDSVGNSNYNSLWITADKRMSHGLQFGASYQWAKSFDYNSRNSQGIVLQDSFNPRDNYGLADFDARHHVVVHYLYELPLGQFGGPRRLVEGWRLSGALTAQSGNPVTITMSGVSSLTNVAQTVRPDQVGDPGSGVPPGFFFNRSAFAPPAAGQFGNSPRNEAVIGPKFFNWDFSITKVTAVTERVKTEFRTEFFNLFNHPNFGQPNGICCAGNFGKITNTRTPSGDFGSARQIQFALKLLF